MKLKNIAYISGAIFIIISAEAILRLITGDYTGYFFRALADTPSTMIYVLLDIATLSINGLFFIMLARRL